ncbi:hypothetical protein [Myxococcus sp. Y35]|uniref:hypothetical protein n=1 Tax=Pseudomyxococcus flavus TaxID=3115648 RepID=UPI003CE7B6E8
MAPKRAPAFSKVMGSIHLMTVDEKRPGTVRTVSVDAGGSGNTMGEGNEPATTWFTRAFTYSATLVAPVPRSPRKVTAIIEDSGVPAATPGARVTAPGPGCPWGPG